MNDDQIMIAGIQEGDSEIMPMSRVMDEELFNDLLGVGFDFLRDPEASQ